MSLRFSAKTKDFGVFIKSTLSRLWQRRSSSFCLGSSNFCRRVCRHSRVEPCLQVTNAVVLKVLDIWVSCKHVFLFGLRYVVLPYVHLLNVCLAGVQKTPDRKVVGSPGVQGSPKKVRGQLLSSFNMFWFLKYKCLLADM